MSQRRQRRSLLGTPQPVQRTRAPQVAREEAPPVPMHLKVEAFEDFEDTSDDPTIDDVFPSMPPDPGLVHVDLAVHELVELPMDAIDDLDDLEEFEHLEFQELNEHTDVTQEAPRHPASSPSVQALPSKLTSSPRPIPAAPPQPDTIYVKMIGTFIVSMLAMMFLTLLPWWLFVSPALQTAREARRQAPQIIEVPRPFVVEKLVPMPVPVAAEPVVAKVEEPEVAEPAPAKPAPTRPKPRARPRPRPAPAQVAPVPVAAPEPVVVAPPPPKPRATVPPEARALNGKVRGKAGGDTFYADVIHKPNGRAIVHVKRGDDAWVTARGTYTVQPGLTTLSVAEPGADGATYQIQLTDSGATGQITYANGKQKSLKASR